MKKKTLLGVIVFIISILIMGCNKEAKEQELKKSVFFMYTDNNKEVYTLDNNLKKVKLAENVTDITYSKTLNGYFFVDNQNDLYYTNENGKKDKIDSNVISMNMDPTGTYMYYLNNTGDLYLKTKDKEREKIDTDIYYFELLNNNALHYLNRGLTSFIKRNSEESKEISRCSSLCKFNYNQNKVLYTVKDNLYLKDLETKKEERLTDKSGTNSSFDFINDNDVIYLSNFRMNDINNECCYKGDIYYKRNNEEERLLAENVSDLMLTEDKKGMYYISADRSLFYRSLQSNENKKLVDNINKIKYVNKDAYVVDIDKNIYKISTNGENKLIAKDYKIIEEFNGTIAILTDHGKLYIDDKEISTNVKSFNVNGQDLAYVTDKNQVFLIENGKEPKIVIDDVTCYSKICLTCNKVLYEKKLDINEIEGHWQNVKNSREMLNISDGKFTFLSVSGESSKKANIQLAADNAMVIRLDNYNEDIIVEVIDNNNIKVGGIVYNKINKDTYNTFLATINKSKESAIIKLGSKVKFDDLICKDNKVYFIYTKKNDINKGIIVSTDGTTYNMKKYKKDGVLKLI